MLDDDNKIHACLIIALFFFNDTATTEIYTLSLHDALPIYSATAAKLPIIHDCAAGIADVQVRNRGTIGGSIAEADPSGDWATVLLTQATEIRCLSPQGERAVPLDQFITDAYTTVLAHDELVSEIRVKIPPIRTGAAYLA